MGEPFALQLASCLTCSCGSGCQVEDELAAEQRAALQHQQRADALGEEASAHPGLPTPLP